MTEQLYRVKYRNYPLPELAWPVEEGGYVGAYDATGFTFQQAIDLIALWKINALGAYYDYWIEPA